MIRATGYGRIDMRRGKAALLLLVAVGCCNLVQPVDARPLLDRQWIEVSTPNFVIWSDASRSRAESVAVELETFRAAVALVTNVDRLEQRVPTYIYLASRNYPELGLNKNVAGTFHPGIRANYTVALLKSGWGADNLIKHEYVHFILRNHGQHVYPPWYDEGFADMLSTLQVRTRIVEYGRGVPVYLSILRYQGPGLGSRIGRSGGWMPFDQLLAAPEALSGQDAAPLFYSQSWLLVHYLLLGRPGIDHTAQLSQYLSFREAGASAVDAFEQAFAIPVNTLGSALRRYRDTLNYIRLTMEKPFPPAVTTVRTMTRDETAVRIAALALHSDKPDDALRWFDTALAEHPGNCDALAGKGAALTQADRLDEAASYLEKALEIHPGDPLHELDLANYYLALAMAQQDDAALRRTTLTEARRHFARSYKADSRVPETLLMNGLSYRFPGEDLSKAIASLEEAAWLLPSHSRPRFELAKAYLDSGRTAEAAAHIAKLLAWAPPDEVEALRELERRIAAATQSRADDEPAR